MTSTNPSLPPRFQKSSVPGHGYSFSLASYNPSQLFAPVTMFNPLATSPGVNMDQSGPMLDVPPRLHAPQGIMPVSINMPSMTPSISSAGPSRSTSTIPDFTRGFGIDIPEEDEEALHSFGQYDILPANHELSEGDNDGTEERDQVHELKAVAEVDENEHEDDNTTAGVHTRHVSKASIPTLEAPVQIHENIEENAPPELEQPVHWNLSGRAITPIPYSVDKGTQEMVADWTGSEGDEAVCNKKNRPFVPDS